MCEAMPDFMVQCRMPDGMTDWFYTDDEAEARAWAAAAYAEEAGAVGVYGLLVLDAGDGAGPLGRYAGLSAGTGVACACGMSLPSAACHGPAGSM